jgi:hypothetical protein
MTYYTHWLASSDGVAHAHVAGRTLCGAPGTTERFAWPVASRCPRCDAATAPDGAESEENLTGVPGGRRWSPRHRGHVRGAP